MLVTTTDDLQGYEILEYRGVVSGEVVNGINFLKDFGASFRNIFGGRAQGYESELIKSREDAMEEMKERAKKLGANAVIGVKINYETFGAESSIAMVSVLGTAVKIMKK